MKMMYIIEYVNNKKMFNLLKLKNNKINNKLKGGSNNDVLNIKSHPKYFFTDSEWRTNFNFGNKDVYSLILPHAGLNIVYPIFEYVFSNIKKQYDNIIILSTNHSSNANYQCSFSSISNFKIILKILDGIPINNVEFMNEHSYLSVLPYIARFGISVSIIIIGQYDKKIIDLIYKNVTDNTLLIANTDLLHCGQNYGIDCHDIDEYNYNTINNILAGDTNFEYHSMCGMNSIKSFMQIIKNKSYDYFDYIYTSSDKLLNDNKSSVGYVGISYDNNILTKDNYKELLKLPRMVIESHILDDRYGKRLNTIDKIDIIKKFKADNNIKYIVNIKNITGIFVTITKNDDLAGCIGTFSLLGDIINTIIDRTLETAFNDTRFNPIDKNALNLYKYKINFLEKPFEIGNNIEDITSKLKVGTHGISIYFTDGTSATYLPSVLPDLGITQQNLITTVKKLIESLARKAGTFNMYDIKKIELYKGSEYQE